MSRQIVGQIVGIPQRPQRVAYQMISRSVGSGSGVSIPDGRAHTYRREGFVEVGLTEQGLLVALILDLMDKHTLGPPELSRHAEIKLTL